MFRRLCSIQIKLFNAAQVEAYPCPVHPPPERMLFGARVELPLSASRVFPFLYLSELASPQSQYINQLYGLYNQARAEYHTTHESKLSIEKKYFPEVLGLENSAQDKLNSLLFSLRDKLIARGYGTGEVDAIRNAYYAQMARLQGQIKG